MPRVPYPDPLYPVIWADTPNGPDSPPTPAVSGLPDDDDPIQLHLDEGLVRKADNDTVDRWKAFSGPWFDARGEEAAARWKDIEQGLNEIVRRPLGELATTRQRNMYRDIMEPRLSAWGDEARAHAERETQAFNDSESRQRQDLALEAMRRGARLNDMRAVAEGERRIIGEVRGRSRRQGLDPDATSAAETDALGAAHADLVEHLAQHDPQHAQGWLDAHGGMIGDPAKVERLKNMLQPYVAEQQQEGLADLIRDEGGNLPAQHAAVDAMGLDASIADGLKQRLADMAEGDRRTAEKEQDAAFSRVMAAVLDPEMQTLRGIPPADYYALTPDRLKVVNAMMAANLRGEGPAANPELYKTLADRAAKGILTFDELSPARAAGSGAAGQSFDRSRRGDADIPTSAAASSARIVPAVFDPSDRQVAPNLTPARFGAIPSSSRGGSQDEATDGISDEPLTGSEPPVGQMALMDGVLPRQVPAAQKSTPPISKSATLSAEARAQRARRANFLYSDLNLKLGSNEPYRQFILDAAHRSQRGPQTIAAIINAEQGGNAVWDPKSVNKTTGAAGLGQVTTVTWDEEAKRRGTYLNQIASKQGWLDKKGKILPQYAKQFYDLRFDPKTAIFAIADMATNNFKLLKDRKKVPPDYSLESIAKYAYIVHHEGRQGALDYFNGKKISPSHMESNMGAAQKKKYLLENGNDPDAAYRTFLNDITDKHVNVTRFMIDSNGVSVPTAADLYSLALKNRRTEQDAAARDAHEGGSMSRGGGARRKP